MEKEKTNDILERAVYRYYKRRESDHQRRVDQRKEQAMRRIAVSAEANGVRLDVLRDRLSLVEGERVSKAEAYADLAEAGDFDSRLVWLQIMDEKEGEESKQEKEIWKGYVVEYFSISVNYLPPSLDSEEKISDKSVLYSMVITIRRTHTGDFVSDVYYERISSVGVSSCPLESVERAYGACAEKLKGKREICLSPVVSDLLKTEIQNKLDKIPAYSKMKSCSPGANLNPG